MPRKLVDKKDVLRELQIFKEDFILRKETADFLIWLVENFEEMAVNSERYKAFKKATHDIEIGGTLDTTCDALIKQQSKKV